MLREQYYRSVRSIPVSGKTWENVDGIPYPHKYIPFRDGHIDSLCRFVVKSRGNNQTSPQLVQIAPDQKRTFELRYGENGKIIFADEHGNLYSCLTEKGNKSTIIHVGLESGSPSGFTIWGLQDSDSIRRAVRAGEVARANNIDTEIILKVMEPDKIPYHGKNLTAEELKNQLVREAWEKADPNKKYRRKNAPSAGDLAKLSLAFEGMQFLITLRGMQIPERLIDTEFATRETFNQMVWSAIWFYNLKESMKQRKDDDKFSPLNPESKDDIEEYFGRILPSRIAVNYARLHNAGLVHIHPHLGNISLVGSIYDLDSVKGEPLGLGDQPITDDDTIQDVHRLLYGYWGGRIANGLINHIGFLSDVHEISSNVLFKERAEVNFISRYILERNWGEDVLGNIENIYRMLNHGLRPPFSYAPDVVLGIMQKTGQLDYEFRFETIDDVARDMFLLKDDYWRKNLAKFTQNNTLHQQILSLIRSDGKALIKQRLCNKEPEIFNEVKQKRGEAVADCLAGLITLSLMRDFYIGLMNRIYKIEKDSTNLKAQQYILNIIEGQNS